MADDFTIDASELGRLAADIESSARTLGPYLRSAVEATAMNVRQTWREDASGMRHAPAYPRSITYDVKTFQGFGVSIIEAEVGPDKSLPQGALGNLLEFGSVNNAPQGHGQKALEANQEDFEQGLDEAVADSLAVLAADGSIARSAAAIMRGGFR